VERLIRAAAVLGLSWPRRSGRLVRYVAVWIFALSVSFVPAGVSLAAGTLTNASVALSDPRPSASSVTYTFAGSSVDTATAIRCVKVVWATTPTGDIAPTNFSGAAGSVNGGASSLINSSATNWSLAKSDGASSAGQNNIYEYTHSGAGVTPGGASGRTFVLTGLTNSSAADTGYYLLVNTYTNTDCSTGGVDNVTVQFINTNDSQLSLTVDASLSFTINGVNNGDSCSGTTTTGTSTATTLPFGAVTSAANSVVCQDLTAATNATNGYSIYLRYTGQPQNATLDVIADHGGTNTAPTAFPSAGTEAYAYSTNDATLGTGTVDRFTNPSQGWAAATTSNDEVAFSATGTAATSYRIGHQVGISTTTPGGTYSTTIIYTCTPVY
jgi:hypothetical protein